MNKRVYRFVGTLLLGLSASYAKADIFFTPGPDVDPSDFIQTYTVTQTGTYFIEVAGAQGGDAPGGTGGMGAEVGGYVTLTANEELAMVVGGQGSPGSSFAAPDSSAYPSGTMENPGGGGGGGSFVYIVDPSNPNTAIPLIVGGGGGGAGGGTPTSDLTTNGGDGQVTMPGGNGTGTNFGAGGASGSGGSGGTSNGLGGSGGGGGGWTSAGTSEDQTPTNDYHAGGGGLGGPLGEPYPYDSNPFLGGYGPVENSGGYGGGGGGEAPVCFYDETDTLVGCYGSGGGGGGYSGGGGGCGCDGGAGGGGGSYTDASVSPDFPNYPTFQPGTNAGDGFVTIAEVPEPSSAILLLTELLALACIAFVARRRIARTNR